MLACIYNKDGKNELAKKERPRARRDNIIMKVNVCSICGTDLRNYVSGSGKIVKGYTSGHEASGEIVEMGGDVKGYKIGDRIAVAPAIGCGECVPCKSGHTNMCNDLKTLGYQYEGVFAQYLEVPAQAIKMGNVNKIPDNISDEAASLAEPIACALNAQKYLNITDGDFVLIYGSGYLGCIHAELAFSQGAREVVLVDISEERLLEAKSFVNRVSVINSLESNVKDTIGKMTDGNGPDVVITACSVGPVQKEAMEIAGKLARVSLFGGLPGDDTTFIDGNMIHYKELSVHGVHASTPAHNREVLELISQGKLDPEKYISKIFPLEEIIDAFEGLKERKLFKALVKPNIES